jgi:hypothetical protein
MKSPRLRLARALNSPMLWLLMELSLVVGCGGPPQVGVSNYRLVAGLRTAISARRADWLEDAAQVAAARRARGELTDEQFAAMDAIIAQARGGQWEAAETEVIRLQKSQQPTAEEIEQTKGKKAHPPQRQPAGP